QFEASPALCGTYDYGTTIDLKVNIIGGISNPDNYNLSVSTTGDGDIVSSPEGISTASGITSFDFPAGTNVTLTAIPDSGAEFIDWSGDVVENNNPVSFILNEDNTIIANFTGSLPPPAINTQPSDTAVCFGDDTTFTIGAAGAASYQWQVNTGS